jgi:hypothetical protein
MLIIYTMKLGEGGMTGLLTHHLYLFCCHSRTTKGRLSWRTVILLEKGFNVSLHMKTATKCIELDPTEDQSSNVLAEGLIISLFRPKNGKFFDHLCSQKIEAGYMTWQ